MATGSVDANGVYIYGEDDRETSGAALLNRAQLATSRALQKVLATTTGIAARLAKIETALAPQYMRVLVTKAQNFTPAETKIVFDTVDANTGTNALDFDSKNNGFTCLVPGVFHFDLHVQAVSPPSTAWLTLRSKFNGLGREATTTTATGGAGASTARLSTVVEMKAGDIVTFTAQAQAQIAMSTWDQARTTFLHVTQLATR